MLFLSVSWIQNIIFLPKSLRRRPIGAVNIVLQIIILLFDFSYKTKLKIILKIPIMLEILFDDLIPLKFDL